MEPFRYRIITEWSDEDDAFIARIPALPGCSAHGESEEEAAREVRAAADAVLEVMRDEKRPIPSADTTADYSGNIRLRLPPTLHRRLAELATAEETSLNALMVAALTAFIERPFRPPQTESFRIAEDVRRYAHSHFILPDLKLPAADQKKLACTMHTPRTKRVWLKAAISPRSRHLLRNAGYEIRDAAELRSDAMPSLAGKKSGKRKGA